MATTIIMIKNTNPLWSVMNFIPFYYVFVGQKLRKVAKNVWRNKQSNGERKKKSRKAISNW